MDALLTTKEMAETLGVNEKTFRKAIKEQNLPFYLIGRSKRFNAEKVLARIESVEASRKTEKAKIAKRRYSEPSADKRRFENMLGLRG